MPLYTTDALILRTYKLGESDRIVVFLTRDRGKKRGVAKNARQSRRRFGGALEPLTYGRVRYLERERPERRRHDCVDPARSHVHVLAAAHRALITMHLEKDLKSVRVLRDMFSEGRRS